MPQLKDIIAENLILLFVGYNPGLRSAAVGHHFAGPSNRFWKLLHEAGLTPDRMVAEEGEDVLGLGYGLTNLVARPTRAAAELTSAEYRAGAEILRQKLLTYRPRIVCYVGIGVYRAFARVRRCDYGLQPTAVVPGVADFVAPSPSGLNRMPYAEMLNIYRQLAGLVEQARRDQ